MKSKHHIGGHISLGCGKPELSIMTAGLWEETTTKTPQIQSINANTKTEVLYETEYWPDLKQAPVMPTSSAIRHVWTIHINVGFLR